MKIKKTLRKKVFTSVSVTLFSLFISLSIMNTPGSENIFYDMLFNRFRKYDVSEDPVLIAIDQNTLNYFRNDLHLIWPWPRDIYQPIVEYLTHCNVSVISFDILFTSPGIDRVNTDGVLSDSAFAASMIKSGKTTLAMQFEDSSLTVSDKLFDGY